MSGTKKWLASPRTVIPNSNHTFEPYAVPILQAGWTCGSLDLTSSKAHTCMHGTSCHGRMAQAKSGGESKKNRHPPPSCPALLP
eukprot:1157468-Pelagomonas_calceolata.AAC.5